MERRQLGKTGLQVSPLGFGSAPIGYLDTGVKTTTNILNTLLDAGVNVIDTCACYPYSEELVAKAVGHRRDEYILVTKCGHKIDGVPGEEWSKKLILKTVDRSLTRLKTDHLEVMLLHSCDLSTLRHGEALEALIRAREAGKILFVGYSGDNETAAYACNIPDIAVVEISINICDQINIDTVLPDARRQGTGVLVKRPLANAAWKILSDQPGLYKSYAKSYTQRLQAMEITLEQLGFKGNPERVWPRIFLRFVMTQKDVHCVLAGTTRVTNAIENLRSVNQGPLAEDTEKTIRCAFKSAMFKKEDEWPGLT